MNFIDHITKEEYNQLTKLQKLALFAEISENRQVTTGDFYLISFLLAILIYKPEESFKYIFAGLAGVLLIKTLFFVICVLSIRFEAFDYKYAILKIRKNKTKEQSSE